GRTKTTIYRVINEVRAARIMELPLDYINNARFARKGADKAILGPMPESDTPTNKAEKLRRELDAAQPKASLMDEIESLNQQAVATKNEIARANLRLVVSIAKRHVTPDQNFFELVSDGNISLLRAVEKFDYSRGFKFSTYAS